MGRRREYPLVRRCAHEGCTEYARYEYPTLREYREAASKRKEWRCTRHSAPDEVLSAANPSASKTMTVEQLEYGRFFAGMHGFVHGPGFRVWAQDLPPGTTITVTATLTIPREDDHGR